MYKTAKALLGIGTLVTLVGLTGCSASSEPVSVTNYTSGNTIKGRTSDNRLVIKGKTNKPNTTVTLLSSYGDKETTKKSDKNGNYTITSYGDGAKDTYYVTTSKKAANLSEDAINGISISKLSDKKKIVYVPNKNSAAFSSDVKESTSIASSVAKEGSSTDSSASSSSSSESDTSSASSTASSTSDNDTSTYNTGITYDNIARTPDNYKNKKVTFTGEVVQAEEGKSTTDLRVAIGGNTDNIVLVEFKNSILNGSRVLENDLITFYGVSVGTTSYTSTQGAKITIPGVIANIIQDKGKAPDDYGD